MEAPSGVVLSLVNSGGGLQFWNAVKNGATASAALGLLEPLQYGLSHKFHVFLGVQIWQAAVIVSFAYFSIVPVGFLFECLDQVAVIEEKVELKKRVSSVGDSVLSKNRQISVLPWRAEPLCKFSKSSGGGAKILEQT